MMDDMGLDDVPHRVVMEDIKEERGCKQRDGFGNSAKLADSGKKKRIAKVGVQSSASLEAHGIFKKGPPGAIAFGDPVVSDVESSSSSATSQDDDELKEAMMLEELYFGIGPEGPRVRN
ncbi:hypothetical protein AMTRI_Chr08g164860 [Amborella trichopoda]